MLCCSGSDDGYPPQPVNVNDDIRTQNEARRRQKPMVIRHGFGMKELRDLYEVLIVDITRILVRNLWSGFLLVFVFSLRL